MVGLQGFPHLYETLTEALNHEIKKTCSLEESYDKPRQSIKKQRYHFANKGLYTQS